MGHVFHPGHEELHGITVLVRGTAGQFWVGRYHERSERGIVMHDVGAFDPASGDPPGQWLTKQLKFGIRITHRSLVVPAADTASVDRLVDIDPAAI